MNLAEPDACMDDGNQPTRPLVSVIIPLYNGEAFIEEAIRSALTQTYPYREVIVVDDGSTDSGPKIAARHPVRLIAQKNRGISGARNTGLSAARGAFIALLDQDDMFKPRKLDTQVAYLDAHPQIDLVFTPEERFGAAEPTVRISRRHVGRRTYGRIFVDLYRSNYITPSSTLIRRQAFDRVGGFDETLSVCEEHDLFLRIADRGQVGFIEEPLVRYRWHGENTSRKWGDRYAPTEYRLYRRYLPALKRHTRLWWWVYHKQTARSLKDMGITACARGDHRTAVRYLARSFIKSPWRGETLSALLRSMIRLIAP